MIGLAEKGNVQYDLIPLKPLRDLREIQGPIEELLCVGRKDAAFSQDYIHATLTDEDEIYDAIGQIRKVYPNLMALDFDNKRSRQASDEQDAFAREAAKKSTMELFADFYKLQNHVELSAEQITIMKDIFEKAGGER
jgi:exonuclease SbcD